MPSQTSSTTVRKNTLLMLIRELLNDRKWATDHWHVANVNYRQRRLEADRIERDKWHKKLTQIDIDIAKAAWASAEFGADLYTKVLARLEVRLGDRAYAEMSDRLVRLASGQKVTW